MHVRCRFVFAGLFLITGSARSQNVSDSRSPRLNGSESHFVIADAPATGPDYMVMPGEASTSPFTMIAESEQATETRSGAAESGPPAGAAGGGDLSQQASDPSAPLGILQVANLHYPQDRINVVLLQPVIPFKLFLESNTFLDSVSHITPTRNSEPPASVTSSPWTC